MAKTNPFDYLNSINLKTSYMMDFSEPEGEKDYVSFLTNRSLSYFSDAVLFANEMNRFNSIDKKLQYDFYFHGLPKKRRMSKWAKKTNHEDVEMIMDHYNYSRRKAEAVVDIFTPEAIELLKSKRRKGGK